MRILKGTEITPSPNLGRHTVNEEFAIACSQRNVVVYLYYRKCLVVVVRLRKAISGLFFVHFSEYLEGANSKY